MKVAHLKTTDYRRSPWKNGLGWTDQIAISPANADLRRADFDWRVSTAQIAQSSDFSPFPEHDRILVIIGGAGVRLSHRFNEGEPPEIVEVPPGEPYEFPGDVPTRCDLASGPIQDFSIFIRKGTTSAMAETIELDADTGPFEWELQGKTGFVFVISGQVTAGKFGLAPGESLRADASQNEGGGGGEPTEPLALSSDSARIILVQFDSASG